MKNVQVSHLFGDAISPYLVGAMADSIKPYLRSASGTYSGFTDSYSMTPEEYGIEFKALQYSLFSCCFAQVKLNTKSPDKMTN